MIRVLVLVAAAVVVVAFARLLAAGVTRQYSRKGEAEAVCRVVAGSQAGLTSKWRHGIAKGAPGALQFAPRGPGGLRVPHHAALDLVVQKAELVPDRQTGLRTAWGVRPRMPIAQLVTATATLEIAAQREPLTQVVSQLQGPGGHAPPG